MEKETTTAQIYNADQGEYFFKGDKEVYKFGTLIILLLGVSVLCMVLFLMYQEKAFMIVGAVFGVLAVATLFVEVIFFGDRLEHKKVGSEE